MLPRLPRLTLVCRALAILAVATVARRADAQLPACTDGTLSQFASGCRIGDATLRFWQIGGNNSDVGITVDKAPPGTFGWVGLYLAFEPPFGDEVRTYGYAISGVPIGGVAGMAHGTAIGCPGEAHVATYVTGHGFEKTSITQNSYCFDGDLSFNCVGPACVGTGFGPEVEFYHRRARLSGQVIVSAYDTNLPAGPNDPSNGDESRVDVLYVQFLIDPTAVVTPEPATLALTAGGLLALAGVARRRAATR